MYYNVCYACARRRLFEVLVKLQLLLVVSQPPSLHTGAFSNVANIVIPWLHATADRLMNLFLSSKVVEAYDCELSIDVELLLCWDAGCESVRIRAQQ